MKTSKKLLAILLIVLTLASSVAVSAAAASVKISACSFTYSKQVNYTGKALKPAVKVVYKSKTLKNGTDYTLAYSSNTKVGTGKITVKGKGSYTGSKTLSFKIIMAKPTGLKASTVKATSVKLTWAKVSGATKYDVLSYNSSTKKYAKLSTVKTNAATVSSLTAGKTYKFAVKAYNKDGKTSAVSAVVAVNTRPGTPKLTLAAASTSSIKLSWKKTAAAQGYVIYSYSDSTKKYKAIKKITSPSTVTFTKTGLKATTTYAFAVAAYYKKGDVMVYSEKSNLAYMCTKPATVTGLKAADVSAKSAVVSWNAVSGATAYAVYSYDAAKKAYTKEATTSDTTFVKSGLKPSTKYYFTVTAIKKTAGVNVYGAKCAKISFTTAAVSDFTAFRDMIRARKFTINYKVTTSDGAITAKTVVSGQVAASTMSTKMEGISATMYNWYDGSSKKGITRAKASIFKFYDTFGEAEAKENGLDADSTVLMFAPVISTDAQQVKTTATIDSKKCDAYISVGSGATIAYYFYNSKLIRIKVGSEVINITSYSPSAASSDISKPSTTGWIHMDDLF